MLKNLSVAEGLCNGTRMIVLDMQPHAIDYQIVTGSKKSQVHSIPKINNTVDQYYFKFDRKQFPLIKVRFCNDNQQSSRTDIRKSRYRFAV